MLYPPYFHAILGLLNCLILKLACHQWSYEMLSLSSKTLTFLPSILLHKCKKPELHLALYTMKAIQTFTPAYVPASIFSVELFFSFFSSHPRLLQLLCSLISYNSAPDSVLAPPNSTLVPLSLHITWPASILVAS